MKIHRGSSLSLRPQHPEHARSRVISEAKQGWAWLALGWETQRFLSKLNITLPCVVVGFMCGPGWAAVHTRLIKHDSGCFREGVCSEIYMELSVHRPQPISQRPE